MWWTVFKSVGELSSNLSVNCLQICRWTVFKTRVGELSCRWTVLFPKIQDTRSRIPRLCIITSFHLDKYQFKLSASDINTVWCTGNARFLLLWQYQWISITVDCRALFTKMADHFEAFDSHCLRMWDTKGLTSVFDKMLPVDDNVWQLLRAGTRICLSSKIYKLAKKKYDGTCNIISFLDLGWFR